MFILFDTNIWFSQLGLQSESGAAVRHFAQRRGAIVAVPEIVRIEVEETLTEHLLELRQQAEDSHRQLLPVFRKLQPIALPTEDEIRTVVSSIVSNLDVPVREVAFNEDAARSSMMKILRKIPPSRKTEQFRDGVIWAHCLELLKEDDVYLVSEDKDFYQERSYELGLASELVEEMEECSKVRRVVLKRDLKELLTEIRMPIELNSAQLFHSTEVLGHRAVTEILLSNGFELYGRVAGEVNCFATENADQVYFEFALNHPCRDNTGAGRQPGELTLKGTGLLNPKTNEPTGITLSRVLLDYPDWEPGGAGRGAIFVSAHFNAPSMHQVRFRLDVSEGNAAGS